jgi:hypothetical protein
MAVLLGLAGCGASTEVVQAPDSKDTPAQSETHTVMGRYPARRSGILIAQNAALQQGRAMCSAKGLRFRSLGAVAGEDPATGEAVYAVRFRCLERPRLPPIVTPSPTPGQTPAPQGRM